MTASPSIFLSYASQDREAARSLRDALAASGLTVWYDENELGGGDAWDQKIRRQIRECTYFMPVISAQTEARQEGYFRREWRLAVERTLDMADDVAFLLPVVIDGTAQATARVPEKFLSVQWLSAPAGKANPALSALSERLLSGATTTPPRPVAASSKKAATTPLAPFPREEPGQKIRFLFNVAGWLVQSAWRHIGRLPRVLRWFVYAWLCLTIVPWFCSLSHKLTPKDDPSEADHDPIIQTTKDTVKAKLDPDAERLGEKIIDGLGAIAQHDSVPLLAVPFGDTQDGTGHAKLLDSVFALLYGKLSLAHPGHVALAPAHEGLSGAQAARQLAKDKGARLVLYGGCSPDGKTLSIVIGKVDESEPLVTKTYNCASADPEKIASDLLAASPDF